MTVDTLQVNMTRGELTPYLHARVDTEHYQSGLEEARNVVVMRYGGVTRAPGTLFGGAAKKADRTAIFRPFRFSASQVYALEMGHEYIRFWIMGDTGPERIESGGSPVEVATPYQEADLRYIQIRQSADVIYIASKFYQPRVLRRNSETSWTLSLYDPVDGPYLDINTADTRLVPSARGDIADNAGTAAASVAPQDVGLPASNAFDGNKGSVAGFHIGSGTISWTFSSGTEVADAYWITASPNGLTAPLNWSLEGYDGSNWIALDTREGEAGWAGGETRFFAFANQTAYEAYRLNWRGSNYDVSDPYTQFADIGIHQRAETQSGITLTASTATGINGGAGFLASDVGRYVRLLGSDGQWRAAKITARTSTTVVEVQIHGHSLPDTRPISRWRLGAWSNETGWPAAIALYEDRLALAGTAGDPIGGAASVSQDYDSFAVSNPIVDDDAVTFRLTGGELNEIRWLVESRDMVAGTAGSLRVIGRNNSNAAFGPSNVRQRPETIVGASYAVPVTVENMILFMDADETRLYEAAYTYEIEGYLARELSAVNEHLFGVGVVEIGYQSHPHRILWGRRADGKMVACTYDRDQKVFGVTLVDFGGVVEGMTFLPGDKKTDMFMIVKRTIDGDVVRYAEGLAEFYRDELTLVGCPVYAASAVIYDGSAITTVTGLGHLEGETVAVYGDGVDLGDYVVDSGEVGPLPVARSNIVVGLRMPWRVKTLRLAQIGNQDGSGLGRKVDIVEGIVDLYESAGVSVESNGNVDPLKYEEDFESDPFDPPALRTGMKGLAVDDSWKDNGQIVFSGDKLYPVTIRAISLKIDGEP